MYKKSFFYWVLIDLISIAIESYLTRTSPSSVSFLGFLNSKRSIITKTPPLTGDWKGLNGAWYRRFLKALEKFNLPPVTEEVNIFYFNGPGHLLTDIT